MAAIGIADDHGPNVAPIREIVEAREFADHPSFAALLEADPHVAHCGSRCRIGIAIVDVDIADVLHLERRFESGRARIGPCHFGVSTREGNSGQVGTGGYELRW